MSLEAPDPQFQVYINSPRSIIALCRHGYGPEDLYLKPKGDFVEETKDPARGKLIYDGTLKKLQRRLSEVKATFEEIKRNGISEEEWDFLGQPLSLRSIVNFNPEKKAAIQQMEDKSQQIFLKNIRAEKYRMQKELEYEDQMNFVEAEAKKK